MRLVHGFQALLPLFVIVVLQWGLSPASSLVSSSSSSLCSSSSKHYLDIVNVFGRLAEQKALGYTSSYDTYVPTPLALWLPNRWSRRLRVNEPDWRKIFTTVATNTDDGSSAGSFKTNRMQFCETVRSLPFKYPADCEFPVEVRKAENLEEASLTGEALLRREGGAETLSRIERRMQSLPISEEVLSTVYHLFGGREELSMVGMESRILEIGMLACADDPVIDFETFLSQCAKQLSSTRTT